MNRITLVLVLLSLSIPGDAADLVVQPKPILGTEVNTKPGSLKTVLASISQQTGWPLELSDGDASADVPDRFERQGYWSAVEQLANRTGSRIVLDGSKVKLVKRAEGLKQAPSSIDGPFRVVVKKVVARRDFEAAMSEYEVHLEIMWEPRFPVYLIDTEPKITTATAAGKPLASDAPTGRVLPTGYSHLAVVRLRNVPRGVPKLDLLSGSFRLIAAEKMLSFEFTDLVTDQPTTQTTDGVKVTLKPVRKLEKRAEVGFDLQYPESHPSFESFQLWAGMNKLKLMSPDNATSFLPTDFNTDENGRRVRADYNFSGPNGQAFQLPNLKGWRAVYQTPCPMIEQTITMTLKEIDLP
jgi:hypothetical protein